MTYYSVFQFYLNIHPVFNNFIGKSVWNFNFCILNLKTSAGVSQILCFAAHINDSKLIMMLSKVIIVAYGNFHILFKIKLLITW